MAKIRVPGDHPVGIYRPFGTGLGLKPLNEKGKELFKAFLSGVNPDHLQSILIKFLRSAGRVRDSVRNTLVPHSAIETIEELERIRVNQLMETLKKQGTFALEPIPEENPKVTETLSEAVMKHFLFVLQNPFLAESNPQAAQISDYVRAQFYVPETAFDPEDVEYQTQWNAYRRLAEFMRELPLEQTYRQALWELRRNKLFPPQFEIPSLKEICEPLLGFTQPSHYTRPKNIDYKVLIKALKNSPEKLLSFMKMGLTGGAPDIIHVSKKEFIFADCSQESPLGRRNCVFDESGEASLEGDFFNHVVRMAQLMRVDIMDTGIYRYLFHNAEYLDAQPDVHIPTPEGVSASARGIGQFDRGSSSWVRHFDGRPFRATSNSFNAIGIDYSPANFHHQSRGWRGVLRVEMT